MKKEFITGIKAGIPICLGYFFVSFGVGILAVSNGLPVWAAVVISATNLTSAGEVAGIGVIAASGTYIEMILTQLLINCRYSLMAVSLSQNLSDNFRLPHRVIASYGITDEIFGVAVAKKEPVTPFYMYGMIGIATVGWVLGTFFGAVAGDILPERLTAALGILLYGMFIAIIIPPVRESIKDLFVILISAVISCMLFYLPEFTGFPKISSGFSIIISAVIASAILALAAPVKEVEAR